MKITLPLLEPVLDDVISDDVKNLFRIDAELYVWSISNDVRVFNVSINFGVDKEQALMFEVDLDDLEKFAHILVKDIEMLRRDYSDVIQKKIKQKENL
jgi:hypothetical protein